MKLSAIRDGAIIGAQVLFALVVLALIAIAVHGGASMDAVVRPPLP